MQADGGTITVGADGIKVTDGEFVTPGDQTTALADYLLLAGGNLTGGVTQTVRAISPSRWDLEEGATSGRLAALTCPTQKTLSWA